MRRGRYADPIRWHERGQATYRRLALLDTVSETRLAEANETMKSARGLVGFLACLLCLACGNRGLVTDGAVLDPTVTGSWLGILDSQTTMSLVLSQDENGGGVAGSGSFVTAGVSVAITLTSGVHIFPNLILTLNADGFGTFNLTGRVTSTFINAELDGSGFSQDGIVFSKQ